MNKQYSLPLPYDESMTAENFMVTASNREAVAWIMERDPYAWPHHCLILYGPKGCGKTHLLEVWSEKNRAKRIKIGEDLITEVLEGTKNHFLPEEKFLQTFSIDNVDKIAGNVVLEEWLKHLYDAAQIAKAYLLLTAQKPPNDWGITLKDIESRLKSCPLVEIKQPDDDLMRGLLLKMFTDRQLSVEPEVIDYLTPRLERTAAVLQQVVDLLDKKALEESRKITVPFVQSVLQT